MSILSTRSVSFGYDKSDKAIINDLELTFSPGWTGLIGPNGCGKSTLLKILAGQLKPISGEVIGAEGVKDYCEQETHNSPSGYAEFCADFGSTALALKSSLALHDLFDVAWHHLSPGEQKRFQLACALVQRPDFLFIDEPTNHLDAKNRDFILSTLRDFRGTGVLVSHDRELLNALTKKCIFFVGDQIFEIAGNYEEAHSQLEQRFDHFRDQQKHIKEKSIRLKQEAQRLTKVSQASKGRISKRGLDRADHDGKGKIDAARLTGKDASLDQKKQNTLARMQRLESSLDQFKLNKDYSGPIFFADESRRDKVIFHEKEGLFSLGNGFELRFPELVIKSKMRIALTGENGVGKTSLVRYMIADPSFKKNLCFYLPQDLTQTALSQLKEDISLLNQDDYAMIFKIVSRLGSNAKNILQSNSWSPGEARKMAIALAIVRKAELLVLDEPTNHLDLPSMEKLKTALQESSLALLIVSHDKFFIEDLCSISWHIARQDDRGLVLTITQ